MSTLKGLLSITWKVLLVAVIGHWLFANVTALHESRVPSDTQYAFPSGDVDPTMLALVIETAEDELRRLPGSDGVSIAWDSPLVTDRDVVGTVGYTGSNRAATTINLNSANLAGSKHDLTDEYVRYVVRHEFAHVLQSRVIVKGMLGGFLPQAVSRFIVEQDLASLVGHGYGGSIERAADWYARYMHGSPTELAYYTRDDASFAQTADYDALRAWFERAEAL